MLKRIDHIAVAVDDIDAALEMYERVFGLKAAGRESIEEYGVDVATIDVGGTSIELVAARSADSPIRRFVDKNGSALHHVAYEVDDIEDALKTLEAGGARLIDRKPRHGKDGSLVAFIHPQSTRNVLYELVQRASHE